MTIWIGLFVIRWYEEIDCIHWSEAIRGRKWRELITSGKKKERNDRITQSSEGFSFVRQSCLVALVNWIYVDILVFVNRKSSKLIFLFFFFFFVDLLINLILVVLFQVRIMFFFPCRFGEFELSLVITSSFWRTQVFAIVFMSFWWTWGHRSRFLDVKCKVSHRKLICISSPALTVFLPMPIITLFEIRCIKILARHIVDEVAINAGLLFLWFSLYQMAYDLWGSPVKFRLDRNWDALAQAAVAAEVSICSAV